VNLACLPRTWRLGSDRGRTNQPDPTFPQSPGIIFGTRHGFLASAAIYKRQVTLIMADLQLYAFSGKTFANLVRYG
jgi:hypothetical protein